jgi:A/G-specific adenine glycosylase
LRIRATREPWPVLVAEVMAQQTQIARVDEAWAAFLERFPTPLALARASAADVLRAWSGLGYNRRAINLQRAARVIVAEHGGRVPDSVEQLEALPGIGPYTSRAIAALAFARPVAPVDTNVRRVIGRLVGRPMTARELQSVADVLAGGGDPAAWAHASMELGATVCRAQRPACPVCPVRRWCASADATDAARPTVANALPGSADGRVARHPSPPPERLTFEQTTRWLRGRIVAHLRTVEEGAWVRLPESLGSHGPEQIAGATATLQREGLVELHADGSVRLPSGAP